MYQTGNWATYYTAYTVFLLRLDTIVASNTDVSKIFLLQGESERTLFMDLFLGLHLALNCITKHSHFSKTNNKYHINSMETF